MLPFPILLLLLLVAVTLTGANPVPFNHTVSPRSPAPAHERRGIAYNNADLVRHFAIAGSHVTWCYNWDSYSPQTGVWFKFVPMLHSVRPDHTGPWMGRAEKSAQDTGMDQASWFLAFNEPDNCQGGAGGSCISVGDAVAGWKKYMEPLKSLKQEVYLGSPAVSNAASTDSTGLGWLAKFIEACTDCNVDFINIHWYDRADNVAYFKKHIENARAVARGRPIWITEFMASGTDDEVKRFLDQVLPWMDASADIQRYAYFMARPGLGMLINDAQSNMSDIGQYYNLHHRD